MAKRALWFTLMLGSLAWSQSMVESAAIAAGSTAGSIAGKKVSDGITKLMNQAAKQAETAATDGKAPLLHVGPVSPKQAPAPDKPAAGATRQSHYNVPPPPPLRPAPKESPRQQASAPPQPVEELPQVEPQVFPPPPPPPVMTAEDFATLTAGMQRSEVLEKGRNAVRITSTVNGRVEEIYHYRDGDRLLGVVRIVDGKVASVERQP